MLKNKMKKLICGITMWLRFGFAAAYAHRKLRRAGARGGPAAEFVLHQPVLQRVEGDHAQPAARRKMIENGIQAFFQRIQFMVHCNAQRLKGAAGRVLVFAAFRRGHGAGHDVRQLQGRFDGRILPCLHDPS